MRTLVALLILFFVASPAHSGAPGLHVGTGLMALNSSTTQGGQGPVGSTLLTHSELFYNWSMIGFGFFYLMDKQGSNESDTAYGPKLEIHFGSFYLDAGYAVAVKRAYTDRSIAEDSGTGLYYGVGTRFNLGAATTPGAGPYFFANYKMRTFEITKQDGVTMPEKIVQKDGYPIFGIGFHF